MARAKASRVKKRKTKKSSFLKEIVAEYKKSVRLDNTEWIGMV